MTATSWEFPYIVTVYSADVVADEYGNPIPSGFTGATAIGDYQPVTTDETRDGISSVDSDEVRFYFPPTVDLTSSQRLEVDGRTYEALGPPDTRNVGDELDYNRIRARRTV